MHDSIELKSYELIIQKPNQAIQILLKYKTKKSMVGLLKIHKQSSNTVFNKLVQKPRNNYVVPMIVKQLMFV